MNKLNELLKAAANRVMTPKEQYEQRVSWIYGELGLSGREDTIDDVKASLAKLGIFEPA